MIPNLNSELKQLKDNVTKFITIYFENILLLMKNIQLLNFSICIFDSRTKLWKIKIW